MDSLLTTTKGNRLFLHEGYQYRYVSTTKKEARFIYRCVEKRCKARLHTDAQGGVLVIRNGHNHSANHSASELRLHRRALLAAAINGDDSRENILKSRQRLSMATNAPSYAADRRFVMRKRSAPVSLVKVLDNVLAIAESHNPASATVLLRESNLDLSQVLQSEQPSKLNECNLEPHNIDETPSTCIREDHVDVMDVQSSSTDAALYRVAPQDSNPPASYLNSFRKHVEEEFPSGPVVDPGVHLCHVLLWEWQCGTSAVDTARKIHSVLGGNVPITEQIVEKWFHSFGCGKIRLGNGEDGAGNGNSVRDSNSNAENSNLGELETGMGEGTGMEETEREDFGVRDGVGVGPDMSTDAQEADYGINGPDYGINGTDYGIDHTGDEGDIDVGTNQTFDDIFGDSAMRDTDCLGKMRDVLSSYDLKESGVGQTTRDIRNSMEKEEGSREMEINKGNEESDRNPQDNGEEIAGNLNGIGRLPEENVSAAEGDLDRNVLTEFGAVRYGGQEMKEDIRRLQVEDRSLEVAPNLNLKQESKLGEEHEEIPWYNVKLECRTKSAPEADWSGLEAEQYATNGGDEECISNVPLGIHHVSV